MNGYLTLKALHMAGAIIFLGNIIVTAWWKAMADRTRDARIIAFAQRQVTLTDWAFTFGGVLLLAAGGYGNALLHGMPIHSSWTGLGHWLFAASGVIWVFVLIPVQVLQARLARGFASGGTIPDRYWRLNRLWLGFGIVATVLPAMNVYVMVFKP